MKEIYQLIKHNKELIFYAIIGIVMLLCIIFIPSCTSSDGWTEDIYINSMAYLYEDNVYKPLVTGDGAISAIKNIEHQLDIDVGSQNFEIFTTNSNGGFVLHSVNDGNRGPSLRLYQISYSPANNDGIGTIYFTGKNSNNDSFDYAYLRVFADTVADNHESSSYDFITTNDGTQQLSMSLSFNGTLYTKNGYDVFDDYDDAIRLKRAFSNGEKQVLTEMGIIETFDTDLGKTDMINTQKLMALIAGGVYQNRDRIDILEQRINELERGVK